MAQIINVKHNRYQTEKLCVRMETIQKIQAQHYFQDRPYSLLIDSCYIRHNSYTGVIITDGYVKYLCYLKHNTDQTGLGVIDTIDASIAKMEVDRDYLQSVGIDGDRGNIRADDLSTWTGSICFADTFHLKCNDIFMEFRELDEMIDNLSRLVTCPSLQKPYKELLRKKFPKLPVKKRC